MRLVLCMKIVTPKDNNRILEQCKTLFKDYGTPVE